MNSLQQTWYYEVVLNVNNACGLRSESNETQMQCMERIHFAFQSIPFRRSVKLSKQLPVRWLYL